jgi:hypothetical protein
MPEDSRFPRLAASSQEEEAGYPPPPDSGNSGVILVHGVLVVIGFMQGLFVGWLIWG